MPVYGLTLTTIFMSLFIVIVCTAPDVYMAALNLTTVMVLPAYAISGGFLWKEGGYLPAGDADYRNKSLIKDKITGAFCVLYCIWCIIGGGFLLFVASSILYLLGFYFYYITYKEKSHMTNKKIKLLTPMEKVLFFIILATSVLSVVLISTGKVTLS